MGNKSSQDDGFKDHKEVWVHGAPTRKSFKIIPREKVQFITDEGNALQTCYKWMIPIHVCFVFVDCAVYDYQILLLVFDLFCIWFNYYNYMTLNKIIMFPHIALLGLVNISGLTHIQTVLETGELLIIFCYLLQFFIVYPLCLVFTGKRLGDFIKK